MSDKQAALEAIRKLPDAVSFREIREEIEFLAAVREGEQQADQGKVIPLEQVEKNLQSWLSDELYISSSSTFHDMHV